MSMPHPAEQRRHLPSRERRRTSGARLLLLLAIPILAACDSSTGPDNTLSGTFALQAVNGQPLPFIYQVRGAFMGPVVEVTLLGDTIELRADGTGERRAATRVRELPDTVTTESPRTTLRFRHRLSGEQLIFDSLECTSNMPNTDCGVGVAQLRLTFRAGELIEETASVVDTVVTRRRSVYQRIPPN